MTWTSGTNLITCTANDSIVGSNGTSYVTQLDPNHQVSVFNGAQVVISAGHLVGYQRHYHS